MDAGHDALTCVDNQAVADVGVAEPAASQQDPLAVKGEGLSLPGQRAREAVHAAVGLLTGHSPWSRGQDSGNGFEGRERTFLSPRPPRLPPPKRDAGEIQGLSGHLQMQLG